MGVARPIVTLAKLASRRQATGRAGERLSAALEELGPTFVKLGQALSVRPDLVGEDIADHLSNLQDRLPPFSGDIARQTIEEEFAKPLDSLFAQFDYTATAAASIAQVHFAETHDGDRVAVKVLRPDIEARFRQDIELCLWLAQLIECIRPALRRLRPIEVVRTFETSVNIEMDLRLEAAAASELRENTENDNGFRVPKIDWVRTGRRVMTLERIDGTRIDELAALEPTEFAPRDILRQSAEAFFNQVFRDGFFHADIHPGNMFVTADGTLCPVDFGIMGRLDKKTRNYLADMLIGFLDRDYKRVAEVHFEAGYVPAQKSVGAFTQAIRSIGEPILGKPLHEISLAHLLAHLFQITETFEMEAQPQLLLLQKTMLVAEGVGRNLDPTVNMWSLARPLIEEWIILNRGPEARLRDMVTDTVTSLEQLPQFLSRAEHLGSRKPASDGHNDPVSNGQRSDWVLYGLIAVVIVLLTANL